MQTIETFTKPEDRWPQSKVIEHHNKMPEGTERIYRFLAAHYRVPSNFKDFVLVNQINQGEALKFGIEHWRGRKFTTSGTLIWQLNDCWPATSWSLIDYFKRPKPSYYFVKRAYSPVLVSLIRREGRVDVWVINDRLVPVEGQLILKLQNLHGEVSFNKKIKTVIAPNSSSKVLSQYLSDLTIKDKAKEFFSVEFLAGDEAVSIGTLFLESFKHVALPRPDFEVEITQTNATGREFRIHIFSPVFAKNVYLHIPDIQVSYSDNYFDLLPKATKTVILTTDRKTSPEEIEDLLVVNSISTET
jgi:beta-mannosidase